MQVTILGAGTAIPAKRHSPSGIYVQVAREHILLDAGAGTLQRLAASGHRGISSIEFSSRTSIWITASISPRSFLRTGCLS